MSTKGRSLPLWDKWKAASIFPVSFFGWAACVLFQRPLIRLFTLLRWVFLKPICSANLQLLVGPETSCYSGLRLRIRTAYQKPGYFEGSLDAGRSSFQRRKRRRNSKKREGKEKGWGEGWEEGRVMGGRGRWKGKKRREKNQIWLCGGEPSLAPSLDFILFIYFFELESCPWSHNLDPLPYIGVHKAMCWGREEEMKEQRKGKSPFYIRECQDMLSQMQRK